jgi:heptosyltransferase II
VDDYSRILVRATNWVGDAVMSLPALAAVRRRFPKAHIAVLARPWVAGLYRHEPFADEIIPYQARGPAARFEVAHRLQPMRFECALLLQNAFDAALVTRLAGIPRRAGYNRDGRGWLLTDAIEVPRRGSIPPHESFYYLELLRRLGWIDALPAQALVRLEGAAKARDAGRARFLAEGLESPIGVSPGAAFGGAKRWLPERFIAAAAGLARRTGAAIALFGSQDERPICEHIRAGLRALGTPARNFAGETSLGDFIERAAACRLFLTNDSGAMHIASALGVPTVTIFGATNPVTTGPTGPLARIVRTQVECSPCLLRECPIDHRCMKAVEPSSAVEAALDLLQLEGSGHPHEDRPSR